MYHGKYDETRARASTQWWLTAGCCGLVVTLAFVTLTMWLGMESSRQNDPSSTDFRYSNSPLPPTVVRLPEDPARPARGKVEKVRKEETDKEEKDKRPTHLKLPIPQAPAVEHKDTEEIREYQGTLPNWDIAKEPEVKESNIKKKSEAVFPSEFDPDFFVPHNVFQAVENFRKEESVNNFRNRERPEIPPFTYIRPDNRIQDRVDSSTSNSYYYQSDNNQENFDGENSVFGFIRKRLQDARDWLITRGDQNGSSDWLQLLSAFNQSIAQRNLTAIMGKLKEMYNSTDVTDVPVASLLYPDSQNGSSLLSFGLLAVDLFLLHNVQQIAWNEEASGDRMLEDPEVVAMNALFLPPDRVQLLRQKGSRVLKAEDGDKGMLTEALEFVNSMLRAILNLNKAFRSSSMARSAGPNTMDCIWTLYCRNLDKTAKLEGPYGFLAKMNR